MKLINKYQLIVLIFFFAFILLLNCSDKTVNNYYGSPSNDSQGQLIVVNFDDILNEIPSYDMGNQHAILNYKDIEWDNDGIAGGWGWGIYNTSNSQPHSGNNYAFNRHGKNFLGFTFPDVVRFKGAYFAKASSNEGVSPSDPSAHSANRVRYHFYDNNLNLISTSGWFNLQITSQLFSADIDVKRVVVEHDVNNPTTAQYGVTDAEWLSMDDVMFVE